MCIKIIVTLVLTITTKQLFIMNYDNFTIEQIHEMIAKGTTTNQDVVDFYGNEWWDDINE